MNNALLDSAPGKELHPTILITLAINGCQVKIRESLPLPVSVQGKCISEHSKNRKGDHYMG